MLRANKVKPCFLDGLSLDYDEIAKLSAHSHHLQLVFCHDIDSDHLTMLYHLKFL